MPGDVTTTGTRAADAARADAPRDSDPVADAAPAEAGTAAVPGRGAGNDAAPDASDAPEAPGTPDTPPRLTGPEPGRARSERTGRGESSASRAGGGQSRAARARAAVAAVQGQAADVAASSVGVRRRLARLGAQRGTTVNPVLEPLI